MGSRGFVGRLYLEWRDPKATQFRSPFVTLATDVPIVDPGAKSRLLVALRSEVASQMVRAVPGSVDGEDRVLKPSPLTFVIERCREVVSELYP